MDPMQHDAAGGVFERAGMRRYPVMVVSSPPPGQTQRPQDALSPHGRHTYHVEVESRPRGTAAKHLTPETDSRARALWEDDMRMAAELAHTRGGIEAASVSLDALRQHSPSSITSPSAREASRLERDRELERDLEREREIQRERERARERELEFEKLRARERERERQWERERNELRRVLQEHQHRLQQEAAIRQPAAQSMLSPRHMPAAAQPSQQNGHHSWRMSPPPLPSRPGAHLPFAMAASDMVHGRGAAEVGGVSAGGHLNGVPSRSTRPEDVMYATVKSVRSRLTKFYHMYAPHKAERVDAIVESFIDRGSSAQALAELNQELRETYGNDLHSFPDTQGHASTLLATYHGHAHSHHEASPGATILDRYLQGQHQHHPYQHHQSTHSSNTLPPSLQPAYNQHVNTPSPSSLLAHASQIASDYTPSSSRSGAAAVSADSLRQAGLLRPSPVTTRESKVLGDVLQEMQFRQEQLRLDGDAHHYAATQERSPGGGGAGVGWARDLEALGHSYQSAYLQQLK
eukprot:Tamp_07818.p1 GENE.Tamp_07818~~Tamp_07818.p1  ORF type:complete len:521 (-),score=63.68 Tamp_07818:847-2409(-)